MFRKWIPLLLAAWVVSCASPKPKRVLTISEQILVDTESAKNLFLDFQKRVTFISHPEVEKYLNRLARILAKVEPGFAFEAVQVKIHEDAGNPSLARIYSFPGTTLSIPISLLRRVEYENELAAMLAFELANVINRHLAKKVDRMANPVLFGPASILNLDRSERMESIQLGTKLEYYAGYDLRGMASVFQRYSLYFVNQGSEMDKKELEFNIREAQRTKSEYLPSRAPIVRSAEFIKMKKGLKRL